MNENMPKKQQRDAARDKARAMREQDQRRATRRRAALIAGGVGVVLAMVVAVGVAVQSGRSGVDESAAKPASVTDVGGVQVGQAGAPVAIRVYLDYQCPACKAFEESNADYLTSLVAAGTASLEYVPVSILDRFSSTRYATRAANAAFCAADADAAKFEAVNEALFAAQPAENTPGLSDSALGDIVVGAGAPESARECVLRGRFEGHVATVTDAASKAGLQGTPYVTVDGKALAEPTRAALEAAVAAARAA